MTQLPFNVQWNPGQQITLTFGDEIILLTNTGKGIAINAPGRFEIDDGTEQSRRRREHKTRTKRGTGHNMLDQQNPKDA